MGVEGSVSKCFSESSDREAKTVWQVFKKLMSPLEYLLFGVNMVFLVHYALDESGQFVEISNNFPENTLPSLLANEERQVALEMMALIDQLLLFFFALKVCLTFSQAVTNDIFAA